MNAKPMVLIVEDDAIICSIITEIFENLDFQVVTSINGKLALELLDGLEGNPKLITSDLRMPEMNGIQFIEKVRSTTHLTSIPVILVSSDPSTIEIARNLRVYGIEKMNMFYELPELVRKLFSLTG